MRTYAVRVVAGEAKGRRLVAPRGTGTRPTSDAVREAIFNVLRAHVDLDGAAVADLFAGSGALGIEALSRGARHCVFVENDRAALAAIRTNLAATGYEDVSSVVRADATSWVAERRDRALDVVFADPPYAFDGWPALLDALDGELVVAESNRDLSALAGAGIPIVKRYGSTVVTLFVPRSRT